MSDAAELRGALQERDFAKVQCIFDQVIAGSFATHPMRHPTMSEARRRGDIVLRWFRKLRFDRAWPLDRALSTVRIALEHELDGRKYEPDDRSMYAVDETIDGHAAELRRAHLN